MFWAVYLTIDLGRKCGLERMTFPSTNKWYASFDTSLSLIGVRDQRAMKPKGWADGDIESFHRPNELYAARHPAAPEHWGTVCLTSAYFYLIHHVDSNPPKSHSETFLISICTGKPSVCFLGFRNLTKTVKKKTDWKYQGISVNKCRDQSYEDASAVSEADSGVLQPISDREPNTS